MRVPRVTIFLASWVVLCHSQFYSLFNDLLKGYCCLRAGCIEYLADDVHDLVIVIHGVVDVFHDSVFLSVILLLLGYFLFPITEFWEPLCFQYKDTTIF